jgi:hypothetical protein
MNTTLHIGGGSIFIRVVRLAAVLAFIGVAAIGCHEGHEGDRCNPISAANGEDECDSPLTCQTPSTCVESYCCPADPSMSTNPFCNGLMCPAPTASPDAGTDGGTD